MRLLRYLPLLKIIGRTVMAAAMIVLLLVLAYQFELDRKAYYLKEAIYWEVKAALNNEKVMDYQTGYGFIESADQDGRVTISFYTQTGLMSHISVMSNVLPSSNSKEYRETLMGYRRKDVSIDVYNNNQVVIWYQSRPINIEVVETGLATPTDFPTEIKSKIWAKYYWRLLSE